jgi:transposase-like protein
MGGRLPCWKENPAVMSRPRKYPVELLERGTRLVFESNRPIARVAADLGLPSETLRKHVRQVEANEGRRTDLLTSEENEPRNVSTYLDLGGVACPRRGVRYATTTCR